MRLDELNDKLYKIYSEETCHPSYRNKWSEDNPTVGHCAIVSLLVNDLFGYPIYNTFVGNSRHFYNMDGKNIIDLTNDQFRGISVDYTKGIERDRNDILKNKDTRQRYEILKDKLAKLEEPMDESLTNNYTIPVYRVDSREDGNDSWSNSTRFFADDLSYFDKSDTGYSKEDAKKYLLNTKDFKVFDPMRELDLEADTWSVIWGTIGEFDNFDIYWECEDENLDENDPNYMVYTSTDDLAEAGRRLGYDVTILRDIPNDHGWGEPYTEYAVHNSRCVKLADASEFNKNSDLITEAKADIDAFVGKFGEDTYNNFLKAKDRLKNKGKSTDLTWYVKNMEKKDLDELILSLYDKESDQQKKRIIQGTDKEIRGKYNYLGEKDGYKVYQPLDVQASMDLGVNTGWCTAGRYGHYGHPEFTPSLKDAKQHWNDYTSKGIEFYYFLDPKTMYGKYAVALYPKTLDVNQETEQGWLNKTNIEIYNDVDYLDYLAVDKLPLDLIKKEIVLDITSYDEQGLAISNNTVIRCRKDVVNITIPNSVTSIEGSAFYNCTSLTSITIPDSLISIGIGAFRGCSSLTSITIPNSVTSIEGSAFSGCTSLTSIVIPDSVTSIGNNAFYECRSLTSITIPNSVTSIEDNAFRGCSALTSINIPNGVTLIDVSAFGSCSSLESITIPSSVTLIESYAFHNCFSLTSVTIPNSVTYIGRSAFYNCSSLTSITIPNSVTSIGNYAFLNCFSLMVHTNNKYVINYCKENKINCEPIANESLQEVNKITEKFEEIEVDNEDCHITNSLDDVVNDIKRNISVGLECKYVIDDKLHRYIELDPFYLTHFDAFDLAVENGLYPEICWSNETIEGKIPYDKYVEDGLDSSSPYLYFIDVVSSTSETTTKLGDDFYKYEYAWDDFKVLTREDFTKCSLYEKLVSVFGAPKKVIKESLNEAKESIEDTVLKVFGEGQLEKGPMYLLPNGKLLNIPEPQQLGLGALIQYKCHACVNAWLLYQKLIPGTLWDMNDETPLLERGWVRGNLGQLPDSQAIMNYIEIPKKKITDSQYETILRWLDYAQTIGVESIEVNTQGMNRYKSYSFKDYTSDEIVDKIKKYYGTGRLEETLKDNDVYYFYRGYDGRYSPLDSDESNASLYTWITDDFDYANEYAKECGKYGKVAKIEIYAEPDEIGTTKDLPKGVDYLDPGDEVFKNNIIEKGLVGYQFDITNNYSPNGSLSWCLCIAKDCCKVVDSGVKLQEKIVKKGNKWQVQSEKGRNMGTYDTKEEAEKRLKQIEYFKHMNEGVDINYDGRGWILPSGRIVSTMNGPHFDNKHDSKNQDEDIRYNFGYERYIGLPSKHRPTDKQFEKLRDLLDVFFINEELVGVLNTPIEVCYDTNDASNFKRESLSPKDYTSDEVIEHIKRIYTQLGEDFKHMNESLSQDILNYVYDNYTVSHNLIDGHCYILKNGDFIDLEGEDHLGIDTALNNVGILSDELYSYDEPNAMVDLLGCVRVTDGINGYSDYPYAVIPKEMSDEQYHSLEDWLYYLMNKKITSGTIYYGDDKTFEFDLKQEEPKDVIKKIKMNLNNLKTETTPLTESTGFPITVYTYQSPKVREQLEDGKTYVASYSNANYSHYQDLSTLLGLNNCPIFGAITKSDLYSMLNSSGIDWEEENILHLEIPRDELHFMEYYDWTDYMYALDNQEDFEEESGITLQELENSIKTQKSSVDYEECQVVFDKIEPQWYEDGNDAPEEYESLEESLSQEVDNEENTLTQEQVEFFKNSKVRDSQGRLIVCYHGTPNPGFKEFNPKSNKSQFGGYKFDNYNVNYFTTDRKSAASFTEIGIERDGNVYACYLNITNPYVVNNSTEAGLRSSFNIKDRELRNHQIELFDRIFNKWEGVFVSYGDSAFKELNNDLHTLNLELRPSDSYEDDVEDEDKDIFNLYDLGNNSYFGAEHPLEYYYTTDELFSDEMYDQLKEDVLGINQEFGDDEYFFSTDDVVRYVISLNKNEGTNYDGIIIPDIFDSKEMFSMRGTDYITLNSSNQIKLISNTNPTNSNKIDEDNSLDEFYDEYTIDDLPDTQFQYTTSLDVTDNLYKVKSMFKQDDFRGCYYPKSNIVVLCGADNGIHDDLSKAAVEFQYVDDSKDEVRFLVFNKKHYSKEEMRHEIDYSGEVPVYDYGKFYLVVVWGDMENTKLFEVLGKYIDKFYYTSGVIIESKQDTENFRSWVDKSFRKDYPNKDENTYEEETTSLVNKFETMRKNLKSPQNDYYYWIKQNNLKELRNFLDDTEVTLQSKKEEEDKVKQGAKLLYSKDGWKVYEITNYEASAKYGKGTKWCISGSRRWSNNEDGRQYWDGYVEKGIKFYFFIDKDGHKYALALYPNNDFELFNELDAPIGYIPDAPIVKEIPVDYYTKNDFRVFRNLFLSNKLPNNLSEKLIFDLMSNDTRETVSIPIDEVVSCVDEDIPDGYLEFEAVVDGLISPLRYEELTGETYDEDEFGSENWDGDFPFVNAYELIEDFNLSKICETSKQILLSELKRKLKQTPPAYVLVTDFDTWSTRRYLPIEDFSELVLFCNQRYREDGDEDWIEACYNYLKELVKTGEVSKDELKQVGLNLDEALVIKESKQDLERFKQWAGDDLYNRFFKQKDRLEPKQRDIYFWMNPKIETDDLTGQQILSNTLDSLENVPTRKQRDERGKEGAELIYEDDDWKVYHILSYEGAVKYGKGTKWCITGKNTGDDEEGYHDYIGGKKYWDSYSSKGSQLYFYIPKNSKTVKRKYALDYNPSTGYWTLFDDGDWEQVGSWMDYTKNDSWNPYDASQPHFPTVDGLPDINSEYERAKKELGYITEELSKEQQDYFKNSVVRDEQGNLLPVYHSSYNKFDTFEGDGRLYWFAQDKDYAKDNFGGGMNVYDCYINLVHPFRLDECGCLDDWFFDEDEDWGDANFDDDSVYDIPVSTTVQNIEDNLGISHKEIVDAFMLQGYADINNVYFLTKSSEFGDMLRKQGYDGVIAIEGWNWDDVTYGVLNANQIKRVTNTHPTSSDNMNETWDIATRGYGTHFNKNKKSTLEAISNYVGYQVTEEDLDSLWEIAEDEFDEELLGYIEYYKSLDESLNEELSDDILDKIKDKFGVTDELERGAMYLLPSGEFLYTDGAHRNIEQYLDKQGLSKFGDAYRRSDGSPTLERNGAIRVNAVNPLLYYIMLSNERPTQAQYDKLIEVFDAGLLWGWKSVAVYTPRGYRVEYDFDTYTSEDIVKKIRYFYSTYILMQ